MQLGNFYFPAIDPTGRALSGVTIDIYKEGAVVNGNQSGASPLTVVVRHPGKILTGDTVFVNTTTGTTYNVNSTSLTTVVLSGFGGNLVLNDGDKLIPLTGRPLFYNDDQGAGTGASSFVTDTPRGVVNVYGYPGAYSVVSSGAGTVTRLFHGWVVSGEFFGQTRDAALFPGSDPSIQIHNALLDLPSQGGIVDARSLGGPSAAPPVWTTDPYAGTTVQAPVLLANYQRAKVALTFTANGQGYWGLGRNQAVIQADPTFPVSTPVININKAGGIFGCTIRDLAVDCNSVTGSIGILLSGAQEGSGCWRTQIVNAKDAGYRVNSSGAGSQQWTLYEVDAGGIGASFIGIDVGNSTGTGTIRRVSTSAASGPGIAGIRLNTGSSVSIKDVHAEQYTHGVQVTAVGGSSIIENVVGHASLTNTVKIETASVVCADILANGATNAINDTYASPAQVMTGSVAFYISPDAAGTPSLRQTFGSVAGVPWNLNTAVNLKRLSATNGTLLTSGDFTLGGNWGTGATLSVTNLGSYSSSTDMRGQISITAGTTPGTNPFILLTFKDGAFPTKPVGIGVRTDTSSPAAQWTWDSAGTTTTQVKFIFFGQPVNGNIYQLSWVILG